MIIIKPSHPIGLFDRDYKCRILPYRTECNVGYADLERQRTKYNSSNRHGRRSRKGCGNTAKIMISVQPILHASM